MVWGGVPRILLKRKKPCDIITYMIKFMQVHGVTLLRIALGIVFLWFGALKLAGVTPVAELIAKTYSFLPAQQFVMVLGVWEVVIGVGLLLNKAMKFIIPLLWLQMAGTFFAPVLAPDIFFMHGNLFLLTTQGEFVVK